MTEKDIHEKDIHEGEIQHLVQCYDEEDMFEHLSGKPIRESDLKKYNLKEGDKIRYTIDKDGYAVVVSKLNE